MSKLKKLIMMANQIEPSLPKEYIQLEYLEATGTQYIDTGVKGNQDTKVEIKYFYYKTSSSNGRIFGSRQSSANNEFVIGTFNGGISSDTKFFVGYGKSSGSNKTLESVIINDWFIIIHDRTTHSVNGVNYPYDYTYIPFETPQNLKIFGFDNAGSIGNPSIGRCAYVKIWSSNIIIRDFIPALRIADLKPGMYDLVSGQFFTNQGTGEFVFEMPNTIKPLPEEYLQLEYIQTNGNQYLDSQIVLSSNSRIEADARLTTSTSTTSYFLYGCSYVQSNCITLNPAKRNDATSRFENKPYTGNLYRSGRHVWASDRYGVYIDGVIVGTWSDTVNDFKHTTSFLILADILSTGVQLKALTGTRIYGLKVYEKGNPVANMVPVLNVSQNKPGLYDKINNRFLINKGTGEFTYGYINE